MWFDNLVFIFSLPSKLFLEKVNFKEGAIVLQIGRIGSEQRK